eukprot:g14880.t1
MYRTADNPKNRLWTRLIPTMDAFCRLDSDTTVDDPQAQQAKAQAIFRDSKKQKVDAETRKANNDRIAAFSNCLDKLKTTVEDRKAPKEVMDMAKRDEARKAKKDALEEARDAKMDARYETALEKAREEAKQTEAYRRESLENVLMYLDHTIGELVKYLTTEGWMENSIIVVASDNGGCPSLGGSNYPLRGLKHSYWEGGVKVPAFIYSESHIPEGRRGTEYNGLMHVTDWLPTLATAAGLELDGS